MYVGKCCHEARWALFFPRRYKDVFRSERYESESVASDNVQQWLFRQGWAIQSLMHPTDPTI